MKRYIRSKWRKIAPKNLMMFVRISITISGILFFLAWLMFLTQNFYPKSNNNIAAIIMNWLLQVSIWPMTLIILFVFIMPIWVTNNFELLAIFLFLSLLFLFFSIVLLFFLNINSYWIFWLIVNIIVFINIIFSLFSIYYLNKKSKKNK